MTFIIVLLEQENANFNLSPQENVVARILFHYSDLLICGRISLLLPFKCYQSNKTSSAELLQGTPYLDCSSNV